MLPFVADAQSCVSTAALRNLVLAHVLIVAVLAHVSRREAAVAVASLCWGIGLAELVTNPAKNFVGRLRPQFYSVCGWDEPSRRWYAAQGSNLRPADPRLLLTRWSLALNSPARSLLLTSWSLALNSPARSLLLTRWSLAMDSTWDPSRMPDPKFAPLDARHSFPSEHSSLAMCAIANTVAAWFVPTATAWSVYGCSLVYIRLQPGVYTGTGASGCSSRCTRCASSSSAAAAARLPPQKPQTPRHRSSKGYCAHVPRARLAAAGAY